jgi:hypothetical protein
MGGSDQPPQDPGGLVHLCVLVLLSPAIVGFVCCCLSRFNPSGGWWLLCGFGIFFGIFGIGAAVLTALVATILRWIKARLLLRVWITIAVTALLLWCADSVKIVP